MKSPGSYAAQRSLMRERWHTHTQKDTNREGGDTRGTGREEGNKESLEL